MRGLPSGRSAAAVQSFCDNEAKVRLRSGGLLGHVGALAALACETGGRDVHEPDAGCGLKHPRSGSHPRLNDGPSAGANLESLFVTLGWACGPGKYGALELRRGRGQSAPAKRYRSVLLSLAEVERGVAWRFRPHPFGIVTRGRNTGDQLRSATLEVEVIFIS